MDQKLKNLKHWFEEKIQLIELYFQQKNKKNKLICKMGEVYFAKMGTNVGAEIDKNRPVLVFQGNDRKVKNLDVVFVFPITSNLREGAFRVPFSEEDIEGIQKIRPGSILIYQGRIISKCRLIHRMGTLSDSILQQVKLGFEKWLYKNTTLEPKTPQGDTQTTLSKESPRQLPTV